MSQLINEEKSLKQKIKKEAAELYNLTKETIENLTDEQAKELLEKKWIDPLNTKLMEIPNTIIQTLADKIKNLEEKYASTLTSVEDEIANAEKELSGLIDELTGNDYDTAGLKGFQNLLGVSYRGILQGVN